jgi:NitT/TauT family transport system substrate-binding protein/putative hydroxymethylpyrimidine transport system substrate-binding protein
MRWVAALLAAVLAGLGTAGCGGDGAEPGASREATLVLDFQPNAVHAGIYAALAADEFADAGVELDVRDPSASTDAPKLLAAGRAEFAILDIHDLGLARERGLDLVGIAGIVQRPLAAVIAGDRRSVGRPRDLAGGTVGVTGLPSDDAVLEAVLEADDLDPSAVERVTIGFDSIAALSAGRVDAATAFWNAEGVILRRLGTPTREFRVDAYGAPRYPELVLTTPAALLEDEPELATEVAEAVASGYRRAVADPDRALAELLAATPELDEAEQRAQLEALLRARAFEPPGALDGAALARWARWDVAHGILSVRPSLDAAFKPLAGPR